MSSKAELQVLSICTKLEKQMGRMLQEGEVVQEGDLLCCLPRSLWMPTKAPGLVISESDFGWYRRPDKKAKGAQG